MKNKKYRIIIFFLLIFVSTQISAYSQETFFSFREYNLAIENNVNSVNSEVHTSFKPYVQKNIEKYLIVKDSSYKSKSLLNRKLFNENLLIVNTEDFKMTIDPLFNFETGKDIARANSSWANTRGLLLTGSIGKKLSFYSLFSENQAKAPEYIDDFVKANRVYPGQGLTRTVKNGTYDFSNVEGMLSYTSSKFFNFQFGHGKNFIGDGYRSLLLSDNSFNYPFFKITTNVWKFQYTNLYASFLDTKSGANLGKPYLKKFSTFHVLSYDINKRFELSFFESIVWQASDSNGTRGFDINYLNPVIFYRPVEFSLGSADNALMGINMKYKFFKNIILYGQFLLDDFNISKLKEGKGFFQEKYAFQLGTKINQPFKIENLFFQTEYNQVQPYVYAHKEPLQNYSHYNQSLAHPLGANFKESVSFINYSYKRWFLELKLNMAVYGADTGNTHWGNDIFKSDYDAQRIKHEQSFGNFNGQGIKTTLSYKDFRLSYLVNPKTNLNIYLCFSDRIQKSSLENKHDTFVFFGIRTSLSNFYYDF